MKRHSGILSLIALILITTIIMCSGGCGKGDTTTTTTSQSQTTTTTQTTTTQTTTTQTQTTTTQTTTTMSITDLLAFTLSHPSVYYEMTTIVSGKTVETKCWLKGTKMRMELVDTGIITFMDIVEQTTYIYVPLVNTLYKMKFDEAVGPITPALIIEANPTIIGEETVDGKECIVIQFTYQGSVSKAWIWKETGFPVKIEGTAQGITATMTFKNFSFDVIDDSMFDLPPAPIVDLGDITELPTILPF